MKTDLISRTASIILIIIFLSPDLISSARALSNPTGSYPYKEDNRAYNWIQASESVRSKEPDKGSIRKGNAKEEIQVFPATEAEGIIGGAAQWGVNEVKDDIFHFQLPKDMSFFQSASLKYEVKGVKSGSSIPKAVNSNQTFGISEVHASDSWSQTEEQLYMHDLVGGFNSLRMTMPRTKGISAKVRNVRIELSSSKTIEVLPGKLGRLWEDNLANFGSIPEEKGMILMKLRSVEMPMIPAEYRIVTLKSIGVQPYFSKGSSSEISHIAFRIDRSKIPASKGIAEVAVFYFDYKQSEWNSVEIDSVGGENGDLVFVPNKGTTQYFAAMIQTPEMPEASAFAPNSIQDIKAANPAEGMNLMKPPSISQTGEASVSYPLEIPAGRQGVQPSLSLTYSSDGGSSWLGMGWNISAPSISVDTRWGVPEYNPNIQSEVYLLNGQSLSEEGSKKANKSEYSRTNGTVHFFERTRSEFKKIQRKGDGPANYYWVVIKNNGTKHFYGSITGQGEGLDANYVLDDDNSGNIAKWYLSKIEDKWGNNVKYFYNTTNEPASNSLKSGGKRMVLDKIKYTGHSGSTGLYEIDFISNTNRVDGRIDLKNGFKVIDDFQLERVDVKYSGVTQKSYKFNFTNSESSLFQTLLTSVEEWRNGAFFYQHTFQYHDYDNSSFGFGNPITINSFPTEINTFDGFDDKVKSAVENTMRLVKPSSVGSNISYGFNIGGSLGLGMAPGFIPLQNKNFTISLNLKGTKTWSKGKSSLTDINGDGLPDFIRKDAYGYKYRPLKVDNNGNYQLSNTLSAEGELLSRSYTSGFNYGFDFTADVSIVNAHYGKNWNKSKTTTNTYLMDYNADGIQDLIRPSDGDASIVEFGYINNYGHLEFDPHSSVTPNPILKGVDPSSGEEEDDYPVGLEIVRSWEAPFDGSINIEGNANVHSSVNGVSRVAVQHNSDFIGNDFNTVSATGPTPMSFNDIVVQKGDLILFRTRSGENGYEDMISWNPHISYSRITDKVDANLIDYSESTYEDGFLLASNNGVDIMKQQPIQITWSSLDINNLSDSVYFKIRIVERDDMGDIVLDANSEEVIHEYEYLYKAGANESIVPTDFVADGASSAPSFMSNTVAIPEEDPDGSFQITFHAFSTSNVDWRQINWRPTVAISTESCAEPTANYHPTVNLETYNRLVRMDGPYTFAGDPDATYRLWPDFSNLDYTDIFSQAELNSTSLVEKKAYVTVKNVGQQVLTKALISFRNNQSYSLHNTNYKGEKLGVLSSSSTSSLYTFLGGQVEDGLFLEFFGESREVGAFLGDYLIGATAYIIEEGSVEEFETYEGVNVFCKDFNQLNDKILHWGQFAWNEKEDENRIDTADLHLITEEAAKDGNNDYSGGGSPNQEDLGSMTSGLNPLDNKFFPMNPLRGENEFALRDYIIDYDQNSKPESLDRWSVLNSHAGSYRLSGITVPAIFNEPDIRLSGSNDPLPQGTDVARGIPLINKSYTLSENWGAGLSCSGASVSYTESSTINDQTKYYSQPLTRMRDLNGDGYPDIWIGASSQTLAYITDRFGAPQALTNFTAGQITYTATNNSGYTAQGSAINEDDRFAKQEESGACFGGNVSSFPISNFGANASYSIGDNKKLVEWTDINGDGLPDRLTNDGGVKVELNRGGELDQTLLAVAGAPGLSSSTNTVTGIGSSLSDIIGNLTDVTGKSFSIGLGMNRVSTVGEDFYLDLNSDGLPELISYNESNQELEVWINTGSSFTQLSQSISSPEAPNYNNSASIFGSLAGSISIPLFTLLAIHFKGNGSLNGQANFSSDRQRSSFLDMNGDGAVDFVFADNDGNIKVYFNQLGKKNKLKKVINPLRGFFTIDYKLMGNKLGNYAPIVNTHNTQSNSKVYWDMPYSKWVMSEIAINDGYSFAPGFKQAALGPLGGECPTVMDPYTSDIDGSDTRKFSFNYDGGVKSRRDREFFGFTYIEKLHEPYKFLPPHSKPVRKTNFVLASDTTYRSFSEVKVYHRNDMTSDYDFNKSTYLSGLLKKHIYLLKYRTVKEIHEDGNDQNRDIEIDEDALLISEKQIEYDYFEVENNTVQEINQVRVENEEFVNVSWPTLGEADVVFPAVKSMETIWYPVIDTNRAFSTSKVNNLAHATKFDFDQYDKFFNLERYKRGGQANTSAITPVVIDTIHNYYYDIKTDAYQMSEVLTQIAPFDRIYESKDGFDCFIIQSPYQGYWNDTVCVPNYLFQPGPCDQHFDPPTENDSVYVNFRKPIHEEVYIYEDELNVAYNGSLIALMNYFEYNPLNGIHLSNMVKDHKVYQNSTNDPSNNLLRHTEVHALNNAKHTPEIIRNYSSLTDYGETTLTYSTKGNLTNYLGPANGFGGQQLDVDYTYDTQMEQFVESVTNNSYGYQTCMKYDYGRGLLIKKQDINGHPMRYVYDNANRLSEVWAPRELYNSSSAATISFEYWPKGIEPEGCNKLRAIPVAITNHNINQDHSALSVPSSTSFDCINLTDLSSRPSMTNPLQTATFSDGLGKVIQVKKDASSLDASGNNFEKKREVSGLSFEMKYGWVRYSTLSTLETVTSSLGSFNDDFSSVKASKSEYDYVGRATTVENLAPGSNGGNVSHVATNIEYGWAPLDGGNTEFYKQSNLNGKVDRMYMNSIGEKIGKEAFESNNGSGPADPVTTLFEYDGLSQLSAIVDPVDVRTEYEYDLMGRVTKEDHTDRGVTLNEYDDAGNLISIESPATTPNKINLVYNFNRLTEKNYPNSASVNDIVYSYGSHNDSKNGAGRVTSITQGSDFISENYWFDELGNLIEERKNINVPQAGTQNFTTEFQYDSWGRLIEMTYPDDQILRYFYNPAGDVYRMTTDIGQSTPSSVFVVENILYDGYGNRSMIEYGNGARTDYEYTDHTRSLSSVDIELLSGTANSTALLSKTISYDSRFNVSSIDNTVPAPSIIPSGSTVSGNNSVGGTYNMSFSYDNLNRLSQADIDYDKEDNNDLEHDYSVTLTYDKAGGIKSKYQDDLFNNQNSIHSQTTYDLDYNYQGENSSSRTHMVASIDETTNSNGTQETVYTYNSSGSIVSRQITGNSGYEDEFVWMEEQTLNAVMNEGGNAIHHYLYDNSGERVMKTSLNYVGSTQNNNSSNGWLLAPYTVYANAYFVATHYDEQVLASKHYYLGSERIASAMIGYAFDHGIQDYPGGGEEPGPIGDGSGGETESSSGSTPSYSSLTDGAVSNLEDILTGFNMTNGTDYTMSDLLNMASLGSGFEGFDCNSHFSSTSDVDICQCEQSIYHAKSDGHSCNDYNIMYWYHPDYLGSVEFVSDMRGMPYQYFLNTPWGENLENQTRFNWKTFSSRYRFNAKEWDDETGNFYYGARYFDPKVSVWLSVDPMAHNYPNVTPYNFVLNNPIKLVDPDGNDPIDPRTGQEFRVDLWRHSVVSYNDQKGNPDKSLLNRIPRWFTNNYRSRNSPDGTWAEGARTFPHNRAFASLSDKAKKALGSGTYGAPNDYVWSQAAESGNYTFMDEYSESEFFRLDADQLNAYKVEDNFISEITQLSKNENGEYDISSVTSFEVEKGEIKTRDVKTWWGGTKQERYRELKVTETTQHYENNTATGSTTSKSYITEQVLD